MIASAVGHQSNCYGPNDFVASQKTNSIFGEISLPITENFELNIAARYTDVEDETSTDPKVSFLWTLNDSWSFRGSVGTSFRVPSLFTQGGSFYNAGAGVDPALGTEITYREEKATDPTRPLVPQTAISWNIGTSWVSENGFSANLDYWNYDYDDYITYESSSAVLTTDPYGDQVLRDDSGNVIQVTSYATNAGFLKTDGIDFMIDWTGETGAGTFRPFFEMTYVLSYDMDDPQWGAIDGLGVRNFHNIGAPAVELRANTGIVWTLGGHSANIFVRYIDGYDSDERSSRLGGPIIDENGDLDPDNFLPIKSLTTLDAQYAYTFTGLARSGNTTQIRIGARNLLNETAPGAYGSAGYDEKVHNPRGRSIHMGIRTSF